MSPKHAGDRHSIHCYGLLCRSRWNGVPGVSFPGQSGGRDLSATNTPCQQNGTYWYHSRIRLQEQVGHYGPIIHRFRRAPTPVAV